MIKLAISASSDDEIVFCDNPQERLCYLLSKESSNNQRHASFSSDIDGKIGSPGSNGSPDASPNSHINESVPFFCDTKPIVFVNATEPTENLQAWIDAGVQVIIFYIDFLKHQLNTFFF